MKIEGLTDFQNDLLSVERNAEKAFKEAMRVSGNKATRLVRKKGKSLVKKDTGNYHKSFKRGKVFIDPEGDITARVLNTSPHGHLIEDGHRQVVDGQEVGFVRGKKVVEKGMKEFEQKREDVQEISKALDKLLSDNKL